MSVVQPGKERVWGQCFLLKQSTTDLTLRFILCDSGHHVCSRFWFWFSTTKTNVSSAVLWNWFNKAGKPSDYTIMWCPRAHKANNIKPQKCGLIHNPSEVTRLNNMIHLVQLQFIKIKRAKQISILIFCQDTKALNQKLATRTREPVGAPALKGSGELENHWLVFKFWGHSQYCTLNFSHSNTARSHFEVSATESGTDAQLTHKWCAHLLC